MHSLQFGLALAAATAVSGYPLTLGDSGFPLSHMVAVADSTIPRIPDPWIQGDPADSLYRVARETLNRREYRTAANLFSQITDRFARSGYAGDALYWKAFALYRLGSDRDLRRFVVRSGGATCKDDQGCNANDRSKREVTHAPLGA